MWQKAKNKFTFDLLNPFKAVNMTYNNQREGDCNIAAQVNYTPELTATIIEQYQAGTDAADIAASIDKSIRCLLYTSPSPRDRTRSRMPSSA